MTARKRRLTKNVLKALKLEAREFIVYDDALPGFGVRVRPEGAMTFVAHYRLPGGRRGAFRRYTIGPMDVLKLDDARTEAKRILSLARLGKDPAAEKTAKRGEITVAELCKLYLDEGTATKKPSTIATDKGRIERHIKPLMGKHPVSEVTRADVERFMRDVAGGKTAADVKTKFRGRAIVKGGKGTAARTVGLLGGIFSFAVRRHFRADNPVVGVQRFRDHKGERFLSPKELGTLGSTLREFEARRANRHALAIIRLLTFTGARKSEIAALKWIEVDLERGFLKLGDSKTGEKVVLIGPPAIEVLSGIDRQGDSPWVFPAEAGDRHFQGTEKVWRQVRAAAGLDNVRLHDLRHSFASMGLAGGDALPVIGAILGHADVKTTSRYAHLADDPVRAAASRISNSIAAAMSGLRAAEVKPLKRGTDTA